MTATRLGPFGWLMFCICIAIVLMVLAWTFEVIMMLLAATGALTLAMALMWSLERDS